MTDRCPKCRKASGDDWEQCGNICPMPGSPFHPKDGDRVRIRRDLAPSFLMPIRDLVTQGRYGTLHVYTRGGWNGPVTSYDLTFDVLRKGAKPHKTGVEPAWLERPPE